MKLILSLTLVWAFASTAGALQCHRCVDFNDLDCRFFSLQTCQEGELCLNAFITETDGTQRIYRDCASSQVCPSVGPLNISSNLGGINTVANGSCCDTDDCNFASLAYPALPEVNGIQCPGCDSDIEDCDAVVSCKGEEDSCFQAFLLKDREVISVSGCGTSNVCEIGDDIGSLPFMEEVGTVLNTTCYLFTTTTTAPPTTTTTTPEPTTTTPVPTTTTAEPDTYASEPVTVDSPQSGSSDHLLVKVKILLQTLQQMAVQIKIVAVQQRVMSLFLLHTQLIDYQNQLLLQQEELPLDDHQQLQLYYQQCLLVNHHQLLLHQIHLALCGQQPLLQLFSKQQLVLHQLQQLLHGHHYHLLPYYSSYLVHGVSQGW
ncbi:unnamed protein product [Ophioblennius macclurei]